VKIIDQEIGDGADRRRKRIRMVRRFIRRAGEHGLSIEEIKAVSDYELGLTGKKVEGIVQLLKKVKKIRMNEKRRYISI